MLYGYCLHIDMDTCHMIMSVRASSSTYIPAVQHTHTLSHTTHTHSHSHTCTPTPTHTHARTPSRWFSGWTGDHDDISNRVCQDPAPVGRTLCLSSLQRPHTLCHHHCQGARVLWPVQRTQLSTVWLHTQGQCEVSTL